MNDTSIQQDDAAVHVQWNKTASDHLVNLLYEMSRALGYDFDKVALKNSVYFPKAHGELESDQQQFRRYFNEWLSGQRVLWTGIVTGATPLDMRGIARVPLIACLWRRGR